MNWPLAAGVGVAAVCVLILALGAVEHFRQQAAAEQALRAPSPQSSEAIQRQALQRAAREQQAREQQVREQQAREQQAREQQAREEREEQLQAAKEATRKALELRDAEQQAEQQRASAATLLLEDEKTRRDRAWAKFYQRPEYCDHDPTNDQAIKCANDFIRAQRQFHEAYSAGKL